MIITIQHRDKNYEADLSRPFDLSIPLQEGPGGVNCFYAPLMEVWPVEAGDFIGSTQKGGPLNFMNVRFNPHGNGTHTETAGHISKEKYNINKYLKNFHYIAKLVSVYPTRQANNDRVILPDQIKAVLNPGEAQAIIIRTLPNGDEKKSRNYSGTNPPYIHHEAVTYLVECGVEHLLIDLPSVDREEDDGKLLAHHAFWQYPGRTRKNATISELIYVPDEIKNGLYLLNLMIASFELDVSPSKPVIYPLTVL